MAIVCVNFVRVVSGIDKGKNYLIISKSNRSKNTALLELKSGKVIDVIPSINGTTKQVISYLSTHDNKLEVSEITDSYYFSNKEDFECSLFLKEYEQIKL